MGVGDDRARSIFVRVIGDENATVAHQGTDVRRFATRSSTHVQNAFVRLRRQRHDRKKTRRALQHVMSAQILGRGADRHLTVVNDQTDFRPLVQRIDVHAAIDQRLRQISTPGLQRVRANRHWTLHFVRLEKIDDLNRRRRNALEEMRNGCAVDRLRPTEINRVISP